MGLFGKIKYFFTKNKKPSNGTAYLTPQEYAKQTGGFVSTTNPQVPGAYEGSSPSVKTSQGISGGGGISSASNLPTSGFSYSGGGGHSSGGGGGGRRTSQTTQTQTNIPGGSGEYNFVNGGHTPSTNSGQVQQLSQPEVSTQQQRELVINQRGIQIEGANYAGDIQVPGTGMTENQIRTELNREAMQKGYSPGRWTARVPVSYYQPKTSGEVLESSNVNLPELQMGSVGSVINVNDSGLVNLNNGENRTQTGGFFSRIKSGYNKAEDWVSSRTTEPFYNFLANKGINLTSRNFQSNFIPSLIGVGSFGVKYPKKIRNFYGGVQAGIHQDIKKYPIKQVALFGVGAGVGAVSRGVIQGASAISETVGKITKVGVIGTGAYLTGAYAVNTASRVKLASSYEEKGRIIGVSAKDFALIGFGAKAGTKDFDIYQGWRATKGRTYLETEQGVYPSANPRQHLKLFQGNVIKEFGNEPGAFHTTGKTFWKSGTITPEVGSSELPGLYGSTEVSTPFSRIKGSGSNTKVIPNWREILSTPGKPGIAYLKPKGFRYSPAKIGKWYVPSRLGYADVPGIKSEIEAIFRPGSGSYNLESKNYYTKIEGVRVPIDVLKYTSLLPTSPTGKAVDLYGGASSYSSYTSPSYLSSVKGYGLISTTKTKGSSNVNSYLKNTLKISYVPISSRISTTSLTPSFSYSKSSGRSSRVSPSKSPSSSISSFISSSSLTPSLSRSSSPSRIPRSSSVSNSYYKPYKSSYVPPYNPLTYSKRKVYPPFHFKFKIPRQIKARDLFPVYGKRFGKWKPIALGKSPMNAVQLGKKWASTTLGVSFKVPSYKGLKVSGFKTKKTKEGNIFIEPKSKRIKRRTKEIPELEYWRKIKSPIKKRKVKGGKQRRK